MSEEDDLVAAFGAGPRAYALLDWLAGLDDRDRNLVLLYLAQREQRAWHDARVLINRLRFVQGRGPEIEPATVRVRVVP